MSTVAATHTHRTQTPNQGVQYTQISLRCTHACTPAHAHPHIKCSATDTPQGEAQAALARPEQGRDKEATCAPRNCHDEWTHVIVGLGLYGTKKSLPAANALIAHSTSHLTSWVWRVGNKKKLRKTTVDTLSATRNANL